MSQLLPASSSSLRGLLLLSLSLLLGNQLLAQGSIRGKVSSGTTGEVLMGATVRLVLDGATRGGAYADIEGNYRINAPAGSYTLITSYISYVSDTLRDVQIGDGDVEIVNALLLEESAFREDLAVEIVAKRNQASEANFYNQKRNSVNAVDGITFDAIRRSGDVNVAAAMQRVSGVSVEGGKYVYVRGLGDRYSKAMLNGADLPGLDPNRNTVQMDIFPSVLIDNVMVYKTFTPDLPGDFTGGLINVKTKDFPDRLTLNFTASLSYNPQANLLKGEYWTYQTGKTDWLGFDDGTRDVPQYIQEIGKIPNYDPTLGFEDGETAVLDSTSRAFRTGMAPRKGNSGLTQNYTFSFGNQYQVGGNPLGFIVGLSYRNSFRGYTGGQKNFWSLEDSSANRLGAEQLLGNEYNQNEVLWGALAKISYKIGSNHKFSFNYMRNQNGVSSVDVQQGAFPREDVNLNLQWREIAYEQRSLDVFQLQGSHAFGDGEKKKLLVDWIGSYTLANQREPDRRFFANDFDAITNAPDTIWDIQPNAYREPQRFYRDMNEANMDLRLNFTVPFKQWLGMDAKLKFGGAYTAKDRQFSETRFLYQAQGFNERYNGNPGDYFADDNLGIVDTFRYQQFSRPLWGVVLQDVSELRNQYTATQSVYAGYAMLELPLATRWNVVGGVRFERTDLLSQSADSSLAKGELDLNDFLPALGIIHKVNERMSFRAGFTRTIARPTFREIAPFTSFGVQEVITGNPNLQRTLVNNIDLRYEFFLTPGEIISASVFYKGFQNPIEKVVVTEAQNRQFTFRNQQRATLYGLELEFRKNFAFLSEGLRKLFLGGNLSIIYSEINIDPRELEQIRSVDPSRSATRPMFGQSPYTVNLELGYVDNEKLGLSASLTYSIFGERIVLVGVPLPDVYEQPRGLLNFFVSKTAGKHFSFSFRARNLLNPAYKQVHHFKGQDFIYQLSDRGSSYSLGVSFNL